MYGPNTKGQAARLFATRRRWRSTIAPAVSVRWADPTAAPEPISSDRYPDALIAGHRIACRGAIWQLSDRVIRDALSDLQTAGGWVAGEPVSSVLLRTLPHG